MGVAPFTIVLTAGVKSPDAISLLGKRTYDPYKSLAMKYITKTPVGGPQEAAVARSFHLLELWWKLWVPKSAQDTWWESIRKLLRGLERINAFFCNLPSQFRSLPHRSPSHCPWRYICPSLGQELSWGWHSGDRLQLWRERWKSVINWFKIYSPSSSQLLSPQWLFSLVNMHPLFTQYQQLWTR